MRNYSTTSKKNPAWTAIAQEGFNKPSCKSFIHGTPDSYSTSEAATVGLPMPRKAARLSLSPAIFRSEICRRSRRTRIVRHSLLFAMRITFLFGRTAFLNSSHRKCWSTSTNRNESFRNSFACSARMRSSSSAHRIRKSSEPTSACIATRSPRRMRTSTHSMSARSRGFHETQDSRGIHLCAFRINFFYFRDFHFCAASFLSGCGDSSMQSSRCFSTNR